MKLQYQDQRRELRYYRVTREEFKDTISGTKKSEKKEF